MGDFLDKAKDSLGEHEEQADKGIDKAGDAVDEKTDSKYADRVDTAQEKADDALGDRQQ